jgi:CBS domain-containing protein
MNVNDIYTPLARSCKRQTNLSEAMSLMWEFDIGALPVVNDEDALVGVVTDRDIAMAVATRNRLASEIPVGEVMSGKTHSCTREDSLKTVLDIMRREQLRRLPVVDANKCLQGMITMNDIVRAAQDSKGSKRVGVSNEDLILALMAIGVPHRKTKPPLSKSPTGVAGA